MIVRVPLLLKDPAIRIENENLVVGAPAAPIEKEILFQYVHIKNEDFFFDGPATSRVAIVDCDEDPDCDENTGKRRKAAVFIPPSKRSRFGKYDIDESNPYSDAFIQASVFAAVLNTMSFFERAIFPHKLDLNILGRKLVWAFGDSPLLIVPRAGLKKNAFYDRKSHKLRFYSFPPDPQNPQTLTHTCLCPDIIAHETGHAILDSLAPDLLDCPTPHSAAMHEAIADLTAFLISTSNKRRKARSELPPKPRPATARVSLAGENRGSKIAEEFAWAIDPKRRARYLRLLYNDRTLNPNDVSRDNSNKRNFVASMEPHALGEVLSGALYSLMIKIHEDLTRKYTEQNPSLPAYAASGKALPLGAKELQAMIVRGLDYMPPGAVSFADLGRAMIAAEQTLYPDDPTRCSWIREQFLKRFIVEDAAELEVERDFEYPGLQDIDIALLAESDTAAQAFANSNRDYLRIPVPEKVTELEVRPRLDVTKAYRDQGRVGENLYQA